MASFIESLETRVLYRRPLVSGTTRDWVAETADSVQLQEANVKALAGAHRAAIAAAAGTGKTLIADDRQALRDALAAGDAAAADAARGKLAADRTQLRAELAARRQAARAEIADKRGDLRDDRRDLARARKAYGREDVIPYYGGRRDRYTPIQSGSVDVITRYTYNGDPDTGGTALRTGLENGGNLDWVSPTST